MQLIRVLCQFFGNLYAFIQNTLECDGVKSHLGTAPEKRKLVYLTGTHIWKPMCEDVATNSIQCIGNALQAGCMRHDSLVSLTCV